MAIKDPDVIKQIIRSNFDKSALLYEEFEQKYGLFEELTRQLAEACDIRKGMTVVDIGCGTGASTFTLARLVGREGKAMGIDFSEEMLSLARDRLEQNSKIEHLSNVEHSSNIEHSSNVEFILCDAEVLDESIEFKADAILYNACIFLIPDTHKTIEAAYELLKKDGIVGMNYLVGMYNRNGMDGVDLFQSAKNDKLEFAPYGRKIVDSSMLSDILGRVGFRGVREGTTSIKMTKGEVKDFYSIPAQSAGLYPKTPYQERLELLDALLDYFQNKGIMNLYQKWGWCAGVK